MIASSHHSALALEYLRKHGRVRLRSRKEREQVLAAAREGHWNGVERSRWRGLRLVPW